MSILDLFLQFEDSQDENIFTSQQNRGRENIYFWHFVGDFVPAECCNGFYILQSPAHQMTKVIKWFTICADSSEAYLIKKII